jgi:hypothetical protein
MGASGLRARTRACLADAGIPERARIAIVGRVKKGASHRPPPLPLGLLGLASNAAITVERESSHLYEPMEQADVAVMHGMLSSQWRRVVSSGSLQQAEVGHTVRALASYGTQWLVAKDAEEFGVLAALPGVRSCTVDGTTTYFAPLPQAPSSLPSFPSYAVADGPADERREPFLRSPGGTLTTQRALAHAPGDVDGPAPLEWRRLADGRWQGEPQTPPRSLVLGSVAMFALVIALALLRRRSQ